MRRLREEEEKNQLKIDAQKDPYVDPAVLDRFVDQVSKFEKLVDGLTKHTLNGPTPLDKEWKVWTLLIISCMLLKGMCNVDHWLTVTELVVCFM